MVVSAACRFVEGANANRMASAAPIELASPPPITDRIALGALTGTFPPGAG
jgi:hypothetical protein